MARPFTEEESNLLKKRFLDLLRSNYTVNAACEEVGIVKSTVSYWRGTDPQFSEDFNAADHESINAAETSLKRLIEQDNLGAVCFYLKTRGRKFGYKVNDDKDEKSEIVDNKPTKTDQEIIADYLAKKNANNA